MAEKMNTKFDEKVIAAMTNAAPLNWDSAQVIAAEFDLKPRAVVASAVRLGIPYERKERVSKSGAKIVSKADLVGQIAEKFDVDIQALDGLDKATKSALQALADC